MKAWDVFCVRVVRWSGWPLLAIVVGFFLSGYIISGRYGMGVLMEEEAALTLHKLMHIPLAVLLLVHTVPAVYLAMLRWGWIKR
jgi:hypothetical protein